MTKEASFRGHNTARSLQDSSKASSGHQLQGAKAAGASEEDMGISPKKYIAYSMVKTRTCQITIQKQKEIAEAEAQHNQPKQVLHTALCNSPYIPEYVGNQPVASVAPASHSQASWPQLPPPPPLQPAYTRSQQPEGRQHSQQQRDFREESEARTVNSIVPESKHIY
jgi:DNA polymerase III gamma/tau subunit